MATLKDVAKEAGLTVTTVSRVLNNRGYISDDAKKRVARAVKKLNYHPNELARSLQNKSTMTIALIVPQIRHPYFSEMINWIEHWAFQKGYKTLVCNSQLGEWENEYLELCLGNRMDGIIIFSATVSGRLFKEVDVPVISMELNREDDTASVECDNYQGGALAAEKLIGSGCSHLLLVGTVFRNVKMPADLRTEGFLDVCKQHGVEVLSLHTDEQMYNELDYRGLLKPALKEHPEIDGVFASSDVIGAQVIQVCHDLDIRIPEDIKVVGFDDTLIAELTVPRLTTVRQPICEMAKMAVDALINAAGGKPVAKRSVLPVTLIERETT